MASDALRAYTGRTVIYVGEWSGCTADRTFQRSLHADWVQVRRVDIPTWRGLHDDLTIWERC